MEVKKRKHIRRKFCWYDVILIVSIVGTTTLFIISKVVAEDNNWTSNLLMSLATSWLLAAILTYIFTLINETSLLIEKANKEINDIFRFHYLLLNIIPSLSNQVKGKKMAMEVVLNQPHLYALNKIYPIYINEYNLFIEEFKKIIDSGNLEGAIFELSKMFSNTKIIQELFDQEYLGDKKKPIKPQTAIKINDPITDYGAVYSGRKRKFK